MKQLIKNAFILTAITLVSGLLLGLVYEITKEPIAHSKEQAKQKAYQQVLSDAGTFETYADFDIKQAEKVLADAGIPGCKVDEVIEARKAEEMVGYVVTTTSTEGYGGDIQISVGIHLDGTISGVAILSISETAGLGMKAKEPEFYGQFEGKNVDAFQVTKVGATKDKEIDALSGATVTSEAMTNAVNAALVYFNQVIGGSANE